MIFMVRNSRLAGLFLLTLFIVGCASEPYYESPPRMPANISPIPESEIVNKSDVTFVWQATQNTHYYEFHIFNREDGDIVQHVRNEISPEAVCVAGTCSITVNVDLPVMKAHAWRVRSGNNAGLSEWNRSMFAIVLGGANAGIDFNINANANANVQSTTPAPSKPEPLQPRNGEKVMAKSMVDFIWQPVPDASSYEFHVINSVSGKVQDSVVDMPATTLCQGSDGCRLTRSISELPVASGHVWRVRAINQNGESQWTRNVFTVNP